ncbi:MAG: hypothetical protein KJO07_03515 [Deltaproteobacteria bacterium]|nr:hypothetical protein [Deltaproteobacteria bacterium]
MMMWTALLALSACGDDGGTLGALDCDWVASDNCWKSHSDEILACAPDPELTGTFSADGTECLYSDGVRVEFDEPVVSGSTEAPTGLTVYRDDALCVRYQNGSGSGTAELELTTSSGSLVTSGTTSSFTLTCPDSSSYYTTDPLSLLQCEEGQFGLPGVVTTNSSTNFLGLELALGEEPGGADIDIVLFACSWE